MMEKEIDYWEENDDLPKISFLDLVFNDRTPSELVDALIDLRR